MSIRQGKSLSEPIAFSNNKKKQRNHSLAFNSSNVSSFHSKREMTKIKGKMMGKRTRTRLEKHHHQVKS